MDILAFTEIVCILIYPSPTKKNKKKKQTNKQKTKNKKQNKKQIKQSKRQNKNKQANKQTKKKQQQKNKNITIKKTKKPNQTKDTIATNILAVCSISHHQTNPILLLCSPVRSVRFVSIIVKS